jgi:hypothetical protein
MPTAMKNPAKPLMAARFRICASQDYCAQRICRQRNNGRSLIGAAGYETFWPQQDINAPMKKVNR